VLSDVTVRLGRALAGRYEIVRELGRGGMAIVFLANDLKHQRQIALKVLRAELGETLAADRFLREIRLAAGLHHPHILALYDSGEADGQLFFVTPFVEGQTVRERLDRERRLPIDDALSIADDVLSALAYSHSRGIVHRDIKPDNILLVGREAIVADFGIAKAIEEAGDLGVTQSGFVLGTSAYMAPEQASGELDARSDIYSLGCTLYEMLVGKPPFVGRTAFATLAQHAQGGVPRMRDTRPEIKRELDEIVSQALEKDPEDRYASADEMLAALRSLRTAEAATTARRRRRSRGRKRLVAVVAVALLLVVGTFTWRRFASTPVLDDVVAVMPFSLQGPIDTSLLSPTLAAELLYTRLSGESDNGPRIVEPRPVFGVAQAGSSRRGDLRLDQLLAAARSSHARRMVSGRLTAVGQRLEATAVLHDVRTGTVVATVNASGSPDSVLAIFDALAARLLIREVGQGQRRLGSLLTEQLSALRPYLSGIRKYRGGQYEAAAADFERAIQVDSTFALAAIELSNAIAMTGRESGDGRAEEIAWTHRDRLSGANRSYLSLLLGRRYPAPTGYSDMIRDWGLAIDSIPERWEASYFLGDLLFHWGAFTGVTEWESLSRNAFERTRSGDTLLAPAIEHLLELAVLAGDSGAVRRTSNAYLAVAPKGDDVPYVRWRAATFFDDRAARSAVMAHLDQVSISALRRIMFASQLSAVGLDDALPVAAELRRRAPNPEELYFTSWYERQLLFNLGRPAEGLRRSVEQPGTFAQPLDPFFRVIEAMYWDGDSSVAATQVRTRDPIAAAALTAKVVSTPKAAMDLCTIALWRLRLDQAVGLDRFVGALRSYPNALSTASSMFIEICAAVIDAELSTRSRSATSDRAVTYLDSLMKSGPSSNPYIIFAANMSLARMFERRNDPVHALAVVRRRPYVFGTWGVEGLSSLLREEGRLAAITGDTAGAIKAYSQYLRLREQPERALEPAVKEVRESLERLRRNRGD